MNQLVVVGKIYEINEDVLKVAVSRVFKNENGEYDIDIIPFILSGNFIKNVNDNCKKNDTIGIKARVQIENENILLIAEKITFLKSKI